MLVASWKAEVTWPEAPLIAQAAYNASNNIADTVGELSGMLAMVVDADSQVQAGEKPDWNLCRELAVCGNPVWADCSDVSASFAEQIGAGEGGPELEEAVHFVDTFWPTKQLGEKQWSLIGRKMSFGPLNQAYDKR